MSLTERERAACDLDQRYQEKSKQTKGQSEPSVSRKGNPCSRQHTRKCPLTGSDDY